MRSIDDLYNHIAYVVLYAPDRFPYRDFIPADQQMNLDRAFEQLREGVELAYPQPHYESKRMVLRELLDESLRAYRQGDVPKGVQSLHAFQTKIFKPVKPLRSKRPPPR